MSLRRSTLGFIAMVAALLALPGLAAATPATLTLTSTPPVVVCGHAAQLTGTALDAQGHPLRGAELTLSEQRYDSAGFAPTGSSVVTDLATGAFSASVTPRYNTTYRVEYTGDGTGPAGTEHGYADVLVRVRPRITTAFPTKDLWAGKTLTLKGSVVPAHPDPGSAAPPEVTIEQKVDGDVEHVQDSHAQRHLDVQCHLDAAEPGLQVLPRDHGRRRRSRRDDHHLSPPGHQ